MLYLADQCNNSWLSITQTLIEYFGQVLKLSFRRTEVGLWASGKIISQSKKQQGSFLEADKHEFSYRLDFLLRKKKKPPCPVSERTNEY